MKTMIRRILFAAVLLAVCIPLVPAWSVESYTISPAEPLSQKAPVQAVFTVGFPVNSANVTFPVENDLILTTDLANPSWTYTITTGDGGSSTTPAFYNQTLDLSGLLLSYKGHGDETLRVTLAGTAPVVPAPANITVLKVYETDKTGYVVAGSTVTRTAAVSDTVWTTVDTPQPASTATTGQQAGLWEQIVGMFKGLFGIA
jgi:hypothetical protein